MAVNKEKRSQAFLSETPMSVSQDLSKERQSMADADPAKSAYDAAAFLPVSGEIISGKEGIEDFRQGNVGMGMLGLLGAAPLALGYGPRLVKGAIKSSGNVINQTINQSIKYGRAFPVTSVGKNSTIS